MVQFLTCKYLLSLKLKTIVCKLYLLICILLYLLEAYMSVLSWFRFESVAYVYWFIMIENNIILIYAFLITLSSGPLRLGPSCIKLLCHDYDQL